LNLRNSIRAAILLAIAGPLAVAQSRVSPRLEHWGGTSYLVTFRTGVDMEHARERMRALGFDLIDHPDLLSRDVVAAGPRRALSELANWEDVSYVRPASPSLVSRQRLMACAGAVTEGGRAAEYVEVGRGWEKRNGVADLRYVFETLTDRVDSGAARIEIERALREWERFANLAFAEGSDPDAVRTIAIRFASGPHGDSYPFDGPRGSLAHTFYPAPPNPEPIAGDMHFDASEVWGIGTAVDLYSVALHEAGHALGLGHSDLPGSVMYPYYHQATGLTTDDITAIQELYGDRTTTKPAPPSDGPAEPPTPPSEPPAPPAGPMTDRTPPSLRITSPATSVGTTTSSRFTLSGTAADDTGVIAVQWTSSTGESGLAGGTAIWSATVPVYLGTNVVTVRAYDAAGNSAWRSITITRR
jgi:hypothetical protein